MNSESESSDTSSTEYTSDGSIYERGVNIPVSKPRLKFVSKRQRNMIMHLYNDIKNSWPPGTHSSEVAMVQKTSEASGLSEYTIYVVLKESSKPKAERGKQMDNSEITHLNHSQKSAVRKLVHSFYIKGEMPTVYNIYHALREDDSLPNLSMETLRAVLRRLRFKYLIGNNTVLLQSHGAAIRRIRYIDDILKYRKENRPIFFVDTTSIPFGEIENSKRKFYTIVHAANEEWFVDGCEMVYESDKGKIDTEKFEEWFQNSLDVFQNGVVVMRRADYSIRLAEEYPTMLWAKKDIEKWLHAKNITIPPGDHIKADYLMLIKKVKEDYKTYAIDAMAKDKGVTVLRLPKYHNELNPFESIWPLVNDKLENSSDQSVSGKEVALKALKEVSPEKWKEIMEQVKKEELDTYKLEHIIDDTSDSYLEFADNGSDCPPGDEISIESESYSESESMSEAELFSEAESTSEPISVSDRSD